MKSKDFNGIFPKLMETIEQIELLTDFDNYRLMLKFATDDELSIGTRAFYTNKMKSVLDTVNEEIEGVLGDHWTTCKAQSKGTVAIHIILVLWRATRETLFASLRPEEQNTLKWACLLHDIKKRGSPYIVGRDHCHAFRSACVAIEVFEKLGYLEGTGTHEDWTNVCRLLKESTQPLPEIYREDFRHGMPVVTEMNSHHNLSEIFHQLWTRKLAPQGSFLDTVLRAVLFHHSIESFDMHSNMVNLKEKERKKWCDTDFYKVL